MYGALTVLALKLNSPNIDSCFKMKFQANFEFSNPSIQKHREMGRREEILSQLVKITSEFKDQNALIEDQLTNFQVIFQFAIDQLSTTKSEKKLECLEFLLVCFQSLDRLVVRRECFKLVGICVLDFLSEPTRSVIFTAHDRLRQMYTGWKSKNLPFYNFLKIMQCLVNEGRLLPRFLELLTVLLSSLSTRKYVYALLEEYHFVPSIQSSSCTESPIWPSFLKVYNLPIDNFNGTHRTIEQSIANQREKFVVLQGKLFSFMTGSARTQFCLVPIKCEEIKDWAIKLFDLIDIYEFFKYSSWRTTDLNENLCSKQILLDSFLLKYSPNLHTSHEFSIFPTEQDLQFVDEMEGNEELARASPKIGIQFLSQKEYFIRNFELLKWSVAFDVKQDVEDCIQRMQPFLAGKAPNQRTAFAGWSRHAVELEKPFKILNLHHSELQNSVTKVEGSIQISLQKYSESIQQEWNSLRAGEALFLLQITANSERAKEAGSDVSMLRGCSLIELQDEHGNVVPFGAENGEQTKIHKGLRLVVALEPAQYINSDYSFNLIMRRNPRENNFKWMLEWVRDCIQQDRSNFEANELFPEWFRQPFLGYGSSSACCSYREGPNGGGPNSASYLGDAIVSLEHLKSVFPLWNIEESIVDFRNVKFVPETHSILPSTKPHNFPPSYVPNQIPFTATQLSAIVSGSSPGICLIVGPPGTGKTDVIAQLIKILHLTAPSERILIVSHSNHALNLLFERLYSFDPLLNQLEIVRLGHGEEELMQFHSGNLPDFSKYGRMNAWLEHKADQLQIVKALAESLGYPTDYFWLTCENASYFFDFYVNPLLQQCQSGQNFTPFQSFLNSSECQLEEPARNLVSFLGNLHQSVKQLIPYEVLRNDFDRARFCLANGCKIVATTSTFLSLKRVEFRQLEVEFSTVIVEEAGQILDVECALAISLASDSLKRLVMVGDDRQLPPIVKCKQLSVRSNFDQSLFHRFIRQGIPFIQLDQQARCRPEIARLFSSLYQNELKNMQNHSYAEHFLFANPCFLHPVQFVNVPDLNGEGESEPLPHYYQNLSEAEWVVATYQYMRLAGYPVERIAILSTYNGQVALIREILRVRCAPLEEIFGPALPTVSTVDKFQGRQADFVLLSLVRTKSSLGHLANTRRFTVAMSRARLGLYIFGRKSLFVNQISGQIGKILQEQIQIAGPLQLVQGENYFGLRERKVEEKVENVLEIADPIQMALLVNQLVQERVNQVS